MKLKDRLEQKYQRLSVYIPFDAGIDHIDLDYNQSERAIEIEINSYKETKKLMIMITEEEFDDLIKELIEFKTTLNKTIT